MTKNKHIAAALLVAGLAGSPLAAFASTDWAVVNAVNSANTAIVTAIQGVITQLQFLRNEQSAASTKTASAIAQAQENATQRNIDAQREMRAEDATRNTRTPIDPCANAAVGLSNPDFNRMQPALRSGALSPRFGGGPAGAGSGPSTGSANLNKAIQIANGVVTAPSPETQALLAQKGACEAYAAGTRAASCSNSGIAVSSAQARYPNADVRADTIFDGAQTVSDTGKVSMVFNDDQMAAAKAYLRNVSNPVAVRELTPAEARTDEGKRYLALRDAHAARLELATRPTLEWLNNRAKDKETIPVLQAMVDGQGSAAEYLATQLPRVAPDWRVNGISRHQLLTIEAERRSRNPAWLKEIAKTSDPVTLQREQLMINAQLAELITRQYMETQKTNIYLGAIYQASLNKDFMPEVIAQFRKATGAR